MGYVAVKGGADAIAQAELLCEYYRVCGSTTPVEIDQIKSQFRLVLDKIMGEGGLYDKDYAAIAFKQASGDVFEAAFILRAFRATLERNYVSASVDTRKMFVMRRISAAFREVPGGQVLGPTMDYSQRLLELSLAEEKEENFKAFLTDNQLFELAKGPTQLTFSKVVDLLRSEGLIQPVVVNDNKELVDITREAVRFPAPRSARLQMMARAETGGLLAFAYSNIRGFGSVHPTVGELRYGRIKVYVKDPSGRKRCIGSIEVTEAEMITKIQTDSKRNIPFFSIGYGLCFGQNDTKAISMGILDRAMRSPSADDPTSDQELVLYHTDGIEAMGFVNHLKLPHYVTFQSGLDNLRKTVKTG